MAVIDLRLLVGRLGRMAEGSSFATVAVATGTHGGFACTFG
jgi:hypothetical protein